MRQVPRGARLPAIAVAVLVAATAVGWGLFVYQPAPASPERPAFLVGPGEPLPPPTDDSYRMTVELRSNYPSLDGVVVVRQREYVPGGTPVVVDSQVSSGEGDVLQYVQYRRGATQWTRQTYADREAFEKSISRDDVIRIDRTALTYYTLDTEESAAADINPGAALQGLYMLRYEHRGTATVDGRTVDRYVATTGWTTRERLEPGDGDQSLYVRQAHGEVLVDSATGAIVRANVTGSVIEAESWAGVMTAESHSITIRYEVDTDIDQPGEPPWVDSLSMGNRTVADR